MLSNLKTITINVETVSQLAPIVIRLNEEYKLKTLAYWVNLFKEVHSMNQHEVAIEAGRDSLHASFTEDGSSDSSEGRILALYTDSNGNTQHITEYDVEDMLVHPENYEPEALRNAKPFLKEEVEKQSNYVRLQEITRELRQDSKHNMNLNQLIQIAGSIIILTNNEVLINGTFYPF